jgi:hypothetical protein
MESNHIPAVFGLNRYLWDKLSNGIDGADPIMNLSDYGGLNPIIPLQEEPGLLKAIEDQPGIKSAPYITYTWYTNGYSADSWYQPTDTVLYTIYSVGQKKLRQIVLLMSHLFKQYDLSAQSVNRFIQDPANNFSDAYKAYNYNFISVAASTGGTHVSMENDSITATMTLRVNYINDENDQPLP